MWLDFVEANRLQAALIPLGGFLLLILFFLFQDRIRRLPRRFFQVAVTLFILGGLGAIVYETLSPQECATSSEQPDLGHRSAR
jgi:transcriptional regulator of nitric oxide reductase